MTMRQQVFLSLVLFLGLTLVHGKPTQVNTNLKSESSKVYSEKDTLNRQLFGDDIPKTRPLSGNYLAPYIGFPHPNSRSKSRQLSSDSKKVNDKSVWTNSYKFEYTGGDGARIYEYPISQSHKFNAPNLRKSFSVSSYVKKRPEVVPNLQQQKQQPYQMKQQQQQYQVQQQQHQQQQQQQHQQQQQQQQQHQQHQQQQQQHQQQQQQHQQSQQPIDRFEQDMGSNEEKLLHLDFVTEPKFMVHHPMAYHHPHQQVKEDSHLKTMPFLRQFMQGMFSRFSPSLSMSSRKGSDGNPASQSTFAKLQQIHHSKSQQQQQQQQQQPQQQKQQEQQQAHHPQQYQLQQHGKNVVSRPIGLKLVVPYES